MCFSVCHCSAYTTGIVLFLIGWSQLELPGRCFLVRTIEVYCNHDSIVIMLCVVYLWDFCYYTRSPLLFCFKITKFCYCDACIWHYYVVYFRPESSLPPSSPYWASPGMATLENRMREEGVNREDILKDIGADGTVTTLDRKKVRFPQLSPVPCGFRKGLR